jgi:hypothetical protein
MPRYAVLSHDWPTPHFDLLLEDGETCLTWRLPIWPPQDGMPIERIPDHRTMYLDYYGPVSGDRGRVTTVERGLFEWLSRIDGEVIVTPDRRGPQRSPTYDAAEGLPESLKLPPASRRIRLQNGRLFLPGQRQPGQ